MVWGVRGLRLGWWLQMGGGGGFGPACFDFSGLDVSSRVKDY